MKEITIELTNYCPHECSYCSSNTTTDKTKAKFITFKDFWGKLTDPPYDILHISGGEPLAHPDFYALISHFKSYAKRVIVHTNAITDIAFNPNVIDGIRVEAFLTVPDTTDQVHILKRVRQGREAARPEVTFSTNYGCECTGECGHTVIKPDGSVVPAPCKKDT